MNAPPLAPPPVDSDRAERLLAAAEDAVRRGRQAGADRLAIAYAWALDHRRTGFGDDTGEHGRLGRSEHVDVRSIGAVGFPVAEFCPAELAVALQVHPLAAQRLMADAVDLHDRLPHTWAAVQDLRIDDWVGRKIAALTHVLDDDAARTVDAALADVLGRLPLGRLLAVVEGKVTAADPALANAKADAARRKRGLWLSRVSDGARSLVARCDAPDATRVAETCDQLARLLADANGDADDQDPETLDQLRATALGILADPQAALDLLAGRDPRRGKAVVYAHVNAADLDRTDLDDPDRLAHASGVARVEDLGAHTLAMVKRLLGHDHVTVKPVIDLNDQLAVDGYEVPDHLAERVHLTKPADVFPYAESVGRRADLDHTAEYVPMSRGGPPGQTGTDNLGKLVRRHHRIKTHAPGWKVEQLPGHRYLWTTPHGRVILVDGSGTRRVDVRAERASALEQRLDLIVSDVAVAA
jgi:hypothetical protein